MDFELSDEQGMLKHSVDRFVQDNYDFAQRKALAGSTLGYSDDNWATFAEMGWLMLPFSEANGGLGGTPVDMAVIAEALGAGLSLEPLLPSVLLGGKLVEALGNEDQKSAILAAVAEGRMKLALAYGEPNARYDLNVVQARATKTGDGYVLNGQKSVVLQAPSANKIVVIARTSGEVNDPTGISAFLVDADASGLRRQDYPMVDAQRASDLWMDNLPATLLGTQGAALPALQAVIDGGGDLRDLRRGRGGHGPGSQHHQGLHRHPQSVRQGDRRQSGHSTPPGRHVHRD